MTGRAVRLALAGAVVLGSCAALAALSLVPYTAEPGDRAVVRLAWRTRGERVRACRRLTADELARLPQHMRQEEVCERRILPYRLRVDVDGARVVDELVRAGGAREDRPLFVFRDLAVTPGTHHLQVTFEREGTLGAPGPEEREEGEDVDATEAGRRARETPARLELDGPVVLVLRQIVLVTYDDERRRLLLAPSAGAP
jgi:hypothetical protein